MNRIVHCWWRWCAPALFVLLAACGGGDDPIAPSITTHPASVTLVEGQTASSSVNASGSDPLGYQWRKNGADIVGANAAGYTTLVTAADNGALLGVAQKEPYARRTQRAQILALNLGDSVRRAMIWSGVGRPSDYRFAIHQQWEH